MSSLIRSVSFDMLSVRIFNESDHLTFEQVRKIIKAMETAMCECILRREDVELEGIGTIFVSEHYVELQKKVCCMVKFRPTKDLKLCVVENLSPEGPGSSYTSIKFTPAECEQIRLGVMIGRETIKGTARRLGASIHTIRKIVRTPTNTNKERNADE